MGALTWRRRWRSERGAELIEMALTMPILLLLIFGIIDLGFMFRELEVVTNAAREGARVGVLPEYQNPANIANRVEQYMVASGAASSCASTCAAGSGCQVCVVNQTITTPAGTFSARSVTVTLQHDFVYLGPIAALVGGTFGSIPVRGRAVMRTEVPAAP